MNTAVRRMAGLGLILLPMLGYTEQRMDLDATTVVGDPERPRMVNILSWQASAPPQKLDAPPSASTLPAPLDQEEFMRQLEYYQRFMPGRAQASERDGLN